MRLSKSSGEDDCRAEASTGGESDLANASKRKQSDLERKRLGPHSRAVVLSRITITDSSDSESDVISPTPRKKLRRRSEMQRLSHESNASSRRPAPDEGSLSAPEEGTQQQDEEVLEDAEDLKDTGKAVMLEASYMSLT